MPTLRQVKDAALVKAGTVIGHQLEPNEIDMYEAFKELFLKEQFDKWMRKHLAPRPLKRLRDK